jgi:hypothetical protein
MAKSGQETSDLLAAGFEGMAVAESELMQARFQTLAYKSDAVIERFRSLFYAVEVASAREAGLPPRTMLDINVSATGLELGDMETEEPVPEEYIRVIAVPPFDGYITPANSTTFQAIYRSTAIDVTDDASTAYSLISPLGSGQKLGFKVDESGSWIYKPAEELSYEELCLLEKDTKAADRLATLLQQELCDSGLNPVMAVWASEFYADNPNLAKSLFPQPETVVSRITAACQRVIHLLKLGSNN